MINGLITYSLEKIIKEYNLKDGIMLLVADNGLMLLEILQQMKLLQIYNMGEKAPIVKANEPSTPSGEPIIGSGNFSTYIKKI